MGRTLRRVSDGDDSQQTFFLVGRTPPNAHIKPPAVRTDLKYYSEVPPEGASRIFLAKPPNNMLGLYSHSKIGPFCIPVFPTNFPVGLLHHFISGNCFFSTHSLKAV